MSDRRFPLSLKLVNHWLSRSAHAGSDAELLRLYATRRDEAAFAQMVKRHGPTVLGVCRRLLGDAALAEDAFQATFLLLAQKAGTLKQPERLAGWLHGVAVKVASRARQRIRTTLPLKEAAARQDADPERREALRVLDEELAGLREVERLPLVLCYLEGLTHLEAAQRLGWPSGSFSWRLARAKAALHDRLVRRGVFLTSSVLTLLLNSLAEAAAPETWEALAVRVASWVSLGHGPSLAVQLAAETTVPAGSGGAGLAAKLALATSVLLVSGLGWWWAAAGQASPTPAAPSNAARSAVPADMPPGAKACLGSLAFRNQGPLGTVFVGSRLTKDGQVLEGITASGAIQRWAFPTGKPLGVEQRLPQETAKSLSLPAEFSHGKVAATGDKEVVIFEIDSGRVLCRIPIEDRQSLSVHFCRGAELLLISRRLESRFDPDAAPVRKTVLDFFDTATGQRVKSMDRGSSWFQIQPANGHRKLLLSTHQSGHLEVLLLDPADWSELQLQLPDKSQFFRVHPSLPQMLVARWQEGQNHEAAEWFLWSWETGSIESLNLPRENRWFTAPEFVSERQLLWQSAAGDTVLWDRVGSKELARVRTGFLFGKVDTGASNDSHVILRVAERRFVVLESKFGALAPVTDGNVDAVIQLMFTPDSQFLVSRSQFDIWMWPLHGNGSAKVLLPNRPVVSSVSLLPRSSELLIQSNEDDWCLTDLATGKRTEAKQATREQQSAVSNMGRILAAVDDGQGRYIEKHPSGFVWVDSATEATCCYFRLGDEETRAWFALAVDPQGQWALFGKRTGDASPIRYTGSRLLNSSELLLFDLKRQTIRHRWSVSPAAITGGAFCVDGRKLALLRGQQVQVLDVAHLQSVAEFAVAETITSLGLSPDGETLAAGMANGTVLLWPVKKQ